VAFREALRTYAVGKDVDPHRWLVRCLADTSLTTQVTAAGETVLTPTVPLSIKLACACELAQYLEPKLRSVVVSGEAASPLTVLHAMPQAQFDALLALRLREAGLSPPAPGAGLP
jgi:hypothetical protein